MSASVVPKQIGILLFDDVELLDFAGPISVFHRLRLGEDASPPVALIRSVLLSENSASVICLGGLKLAADFSLEAAPPLQAVLIPGGHGVLKLLGNRRLLDWLVRQAQQLELVTSACTGALLLAAAGLLDGKRVTTHWRALAELAASRPNVIVLNNKRVVQDGRVITAAGVSAGIELGLVIALHYYGLDAALQTAREIEFPYADGLLRAFAAHHDPAG
jgi:transcriptional regulator GlxA family with amidase domain